jgi:transglutaminase-like putative cysteine protease
MAWVVIAVLVIGGIAGVVARTAARRHARLAPGDTVWRLSYDLTVRTEQENQSFAVALPGDTAAARVFHQTLDHPQLKANIHVRRRASNQELEIVVPSPGSWRFAGRFDIHVSPAANWPASVSGKPLNADLKAHYLRSEEGIPVDHSLVKKLVAEWKKQKLSREQLFERIFDHCSSRLVSDEAEGLSGAADVLDQEAGTQLGRARAMVALCRSARFPARLVTGFELREGQNVRPACWIEVRIGNLWQPFDVENGYRGTLPSTFVPVRRDAAGVVAAPESVSVRKRFEIVQLPPPPGLVSGRHGILGAFDLTRLPLHVQATLSLLLILPFGALITAVFRTLIGLRTFGTFTPTLLAMSFVYAAWQTGLIVLTMVLLIGLLGRLLLHQLKLLMVPRLSIVLTVAVVVLVLTLSLSHALGLSTGGEVFLLPVVIVTMMVERIFITNDEDGAAFTLRMLLGTVIVAAVCYLLLRWELLGSFIVTYPEAHLITIAGLVWIGRYTGYRLTELWRFRDLAGTNTGATQ